MRIYDTRLGRFLSVDPLASKYPMLTSFQFASNSPLQAIDFDGLEAVNLIKAFGFTLDKPILEKGHWYRIINDYGLGRSITIHKESWKAALIYNAKNHQTEAYKTIEDRHDFYNTAQDLLTQKSIDSKWFQAAGVVTGMFAVGGAEYDAFNIVLGENAKNFLSQGNKYLFSQNMGTFNNLYSSGSLKISFITASGKNGHQQIDLTKLSGKELDYGMVEYEQTAVQNFINDYKKNNPNKSLKQISKQVNESFSSVFETSQVKNAVQDNFTSKGKEFDFFSYDDRVTLGKALIDVARKPL